MDKTYNNYRSWGGYVIGLLLIAAGFFRTWNNFRYFYNLKIAIPLLIIFTILYILEPFLSPRWKWWKYWYYPFQTGLVVYLSNLQPFLDYSCALYIILCLQAFQSLSRKFSITFYCVSLCLLLGTLIMGIGFVGFGVGLLMCAVGTFLISFDLVYAQSRAAQAKSQALLISLQTANQQLQEFNNQVEDMAAAEERSRLARELHDSVSQTIFSINLHVQAIRLLIKKDPRCVKGELELILVLTASALSQLRSLITQLRPKQEA